MIEPTPKKVAKSQWHGRAFHVTMVALWMSAGIVTMGAIMDAAGVLTENYVTLAGRFALVFVTAVGGSHVANAADRFGGRPSPEED